MYMYIIMSIFVLSLILLALYYVRYPFSLNEKQTKFKRTLEDMADILNRHNIEYFLFCGTALGCHREGQFIEHDHDIDLGVFKKNVNKDLYRIFVGRDQGRFLSS